VVKNGSVVTARESRDLLRGSHEQQSADTVQLSYKLYSTILGTHRIHGLEPHKLFIGVRLYDLATSAPSRLCIIPSNAVI
jgi:hypothetical protein